MSEAGEMRRTFVERLESAFQCESWEVKKIEQVHGAWIRGEGAEKYRAVTVEGNLSILKVEQRNSCVGQKQAA